MKTKTILFACMAGLLLNGCAAYEKKNQAGAAVVVNGKYLYQSTLDSLTLGLSSEDSLRVVQQYVSQWSKDILMYDARWWRTIAVRFMCTPMRNISWSNVCQKL